MKRADKPEQSCRRQEFVCRLYDVIKDLDRSLKSDCNQGANRFVREKGNPFEPRQRKVVSENKKKGSECCCPPGCCEGSLEFKLSSIPNYPGMEGSKTQGGPQSQGPPGQGSQPPSGSSGYGEEPSQYNWHKPYHNNGCWAGHEHGGQGVGALGGQGTGSPGGRPTPQQGFRLPSSPEEAVAMGCFVARGA